MFISKKHYRELRKRIEELEDTNIEIYRLAKALKESTNEKLSAFAEEIESVKSDISDINESLATDVSAVLSDLQERIKPLEEATEAVAEDRLAERQAIAGINNILSYTGVKHGGRESTH